LHDDRATRAKGLVPFAIAAVVCLVLGALGGVLAAGLDSPAKPVPVRFTPPREVPADFRLRDQDGRWRSPRDAHGKVLVVTFLYMSCKDLCPLQATEIMSAVGQVGRNVEVYVISVDPVGDTPARARAFLARFGLTGGPLNWLLGTRKELAPVWRQFGIVPIHATRREALAAIAEKERIMGQPPVPYTPAAGEEPPDAARDPYPSGNDLEYRGRLRHRDGADFEHSAYVMLLDKQGRQRVGLPFEQASADTLARDMRALLQEPT
jgi:protein SCO1